MTSIRNVAAKGFQAAADAYERGRPSYPADAVLAMVDVLEIRPGRTVLDLAAGTGRLTRLLEPAGATLIAVEPVEAMRRIFVGASPEVPVLAATAEAIPLADGSVDAVVVGQGFHWFDGGRALREIDRILRSSGRLGLIWNVRDERVPWVAELTAAIDPYQGDAPRYRTGAWREAFQRTERFGPLWEASFRYDQPTTPELIVERFSSVSFVAALPDDRRVEVLGRIRAVLSTDPDTAGRTELIMPHRTDVFWCERLGAS